MITSLSLGDVLDLKPDAGPLVETLGYPSHPTTYLIVGEPEKQFDRYWNQNVWIIEAYDLGRAHRVRAAIFEHKWDKLNIERSSETATAVT